MENKIELQAGKNKWHLYIRDEADESVFNEIFKLHEYRIADEVIKNAKHPIVDVGAHAGFFTMHARAVNEQVKIFAIEPETKNLEFLHRHLTENKIIGVKIIEAALAESSGPRKLVIAPDSHNHTLAAAVIPDLFAGQADLIGNPGGDKPNSDFGGNDNMRVTVDTASFSDLLKQYKIKKVSLIKMDIEGGEYEVFEGMSEADLSVVNYLILEYHEGREKSKKIEDKLRVNGFAVQVFPSKFDKTMGFIFAHNKRFKE